MDVQHARSRAAHLGPERRRPQVLDAALAIAVEEGIGAVSAGSVAERLGVTRPVVYACFPDRVAMLQALLDREESVLLADALGALPRNRPDATESDFVDGMQALLAAVSTRADSWLLIFDSAPDPAVAEHFAHARLAMASAVEAVLRPTFVDWGIDDLDRKLPVLVEHFLSSCEGAVRSLLRDTSAWSPESLGELIGRSVYRALRHA